MEEGERGAQWNVLVYQAVNSDSGSDALGSTETNKRPLLSFASVIAQSVEHRTSWVLSKAAIA